MTRNGPAPAGLFLCSHVWQSSANVIRMWWTIEQVAEHTGMTVDQVRHTRSRREWPGVLGIRQGRRLRFDSERVKEGPREAEHTDDPATATVWLLEDIRNLLGQIHGAIADIRRWQEEDRQEQQHIVSSPGEIEPCHCGQIHRPPVAWPNEERADDGTD